jgi:GTP-binding protein LepA
VIDGFVQGPAPELKDIRNFSIIAHIDHGKSTLSDRLLELCGNVPALAKEKAQFLDNLKVERERGITVKSQTASMRFGSMVLNLVDTPGHADFSYEVSRSLAACEGALLLVDSTQGIQAQTLATFRAASDAGLKIIPVITKVDLPHADPDHVALSIADTFGLDVEDVLLTSAKAGIGIEDVLPSVIKNIPPPSGDPAAPLRSLIVDSWFDNYRGAVCLLKIVDGTLKEGDRVSIYTQPNQSYDVLEVGVLLPTRCRTGSLEAGQVGYVIAGMKSTKEAQVGDTLYNARDKEKIQPVDGFKKAKAMVFASFYPIDPSQYDELRSS